MGRLDPEELEALLSHLGHDRDEAGMRYEQLRHRLMTTFAFRRCAEPDRLADETLDRVARRLRDSTLAHAEATDVVAFAYGVAWNVAREAFRSARTLPLEDRDIAARVESRAETEQQHRCLERCLSRLEDGERRLVMEYFEKDKRDKIRHRALLASQLSISATALRLRVFRITSRLRPCVLDCVQLSSAAVERSRALHDS